MWSPKNFKVFSPGKCRIHLSVRFLSICVLFTLLTQAGLVYFLPVNPGIYSLLFPQTYSGPTQSYLFAQVRFLTRLLDSKSFICMMML